MYSVIIASNPANDISTGYQSPRTTSEVAENFISTPAKSHQGEKRPNKKFPNEKSLFGTASKEKTEEFFKKHEKEIGYSLQGQIKKRKK